MQKAEHVGMLQNQKEKKAVNELDMGIINGLLGIMSCRSLNN